MVDLFYINFSLLYHEIFLKYVKLLEDVLLYFKLLRLSCVRFLCTI